MTHVMIDLETLSTRHDAAILSIGACTFGAKGVIKAEFYQSIDLNSTIDKFHMSADTIKWWMNQSSAARCEAFGGSNNIHVALDDLRAWIADVCKSPAIVWGNGSTFDITILNNAYDNNPPWKFWNVRDMRTIKALEVVPDMEPNENAHNALADAKHQAEYVGKALTRIAALKKGASK